MRPLDTTPTRDLQTAPIRGQTNKGSTKELCSQLQRYQTLIGDITTMPRPRTTVIYKKSYSTDRCYAKNRNLNRSCTRAVPESSHQLYTCRSTQSFQAIQRHLPKGLKLVNLPSHAMHEHSLANWIQRLGTQIIQPKHNLLTKCTLHVARLSPRSRTRSPLWYVH